MTFVAAVLKSIEWHFEGLMVDAFLPVVRLWVLDADPACDV